ncbi:MAG: hypothetical protein GXO77_05335 [Calditrichaeota bacterium]|nr:hypothetical protein [Calditrichota bacterium]
MQRKLVFRIIGILFIFIVQALAQGFYFGRNKVQYTHFNWQILKTEHFDIYYYPEMQDVAEKGAQFAEESYRALEQKFNYSVTYRIPLIFYSSHLHFQQTNVTPGFIPENVGGFFEFIKGRVVVPGNGDIKEFRRVIRHELVHVFMHSKIANVLRRYDKLEGAYPPLWFVEGLAEFWSTDWDAQAEMVLRDAVLNNYVVGLENIYQISGTFTMYKVGQDVMRYIAQNYGEDKILKMMELVWKYPYFEYCFKEALGTDYEEFDHKYLYDLKKRYYPLLKNNDFSEQVCETIVRQGYNFKPAYYEINGEPYVVFVANRTGYSSIYMRPLKPLSLKDKEKDVELLVKGEASSEFEAFHVFDSRIDVNRDGILAFSSKSGETDVLYLYSIPERKIIARRQFPHLVGIYSPAWSPDGNEIVFSGLDFGGYKDLYIFQVRQKRLIKLTDDFYADDDPAWSPDGRFIAFASDRGVQGKEGAANIFLLDRQSGEIRYLTFGKEKDRSPSFSADGKYLAFTSDRKGSYNIYLITDPVQSAFERKPVRMFKMTSYLGATFDPCWTPQNGLLYGTFEKGYFQIRYEPNFLTHLTTAERIVQPILVKDTTRWSFKNIVPQKVEERKPYVRKYDLDFAQTQVSQDPIFGTTGGAQLAFTDMLGNDQYYLLIYNNARVASEFWKSFNVAVTKISLEDRVNWGVSLYRFAGYYFYPGNAYFYEERVGGIVTFSYPFSQFTRVSVSQNLAYSDKDWFFNKRRRAYLNSSYISLVNDNSIWGPSGPMDGQRINITFGNTYDLAFSNVNYLTGLIDVRKYFRISLRSAYAVRFLSLFNEGRETLEYYFGGSWDLRLYRRWSLHGKRILLISQELRFPLIDQLGIRFPMAALRFQGIRGALFLDAGNAWNNKFPGFKGSFGFGIRLNLGNVLVLRLDIGRKTDFKSIGKKTITQFFFGWDF